MTRRRKKTDGERIAWTWFDGSVSIHDQDYRERLAKQIDRIIRRRQKEAWAEGWASNSAGDFESPYEGRREK